MDNDETLVKLTRVITITEGLADDVKELKSQVMDYQQTHVLRGEWIQRNNLVDGRFNDLGREVGDLRASHAKDIATVRAEHATDVNTFRATMQAKATPWYQTVAVIVGALGVVAAFIAIIIK